MLKGFFSRYRPRYIRTLVYMLQASEYRLRDYLSWLHRTHDFSAVEKRKHLKFTPKATLLFTAAWLGALLFVLYAISLIIFYQIWGVVLGVFILIGLPFLLAYSVLIPLILIEVLIQKPIEYMRLERARRTLHEHPAIKIGVAGSFGKTTMREILKTVLSEGKIVAAPPHSFNTPLGISEFAKNLSGDEEVLIFELGESHPGDIQKLCRIVGPDIGVITGINEAHLHTFKTLERTVATVYELAEYLKDKPLYVNGENVLAQKNARPRDILYTQRGAGSVQIENAKTNLSGTSFTLIHGGTRAEVSSLLLGLHHVGPLAVAAAIAFDLKLTPEEIKRGIDATKPFDHRLEPKTDAAGVITLDDSYNGNPDGVRAVITFLAGLVGHRRFYVTPGLVEMGTRTKAVHREIGTWLAEAGIERVVLIKNSVTPFIAEGLKNAGYTGEVLWFDEGLKAFAALPHLTVKGDVVLLQNDWPDQYA